jgi:hypothetical protein
MNKNLSSNRMIGIADLKEDALNIQPSKTKDSQLTLKQWLLDGVRCDLPISPRNKKKYVTSR